MAESNKIRIDVWTEHFLGTKTKCEELLGLVERMDGAQWLPERWSNCEPVRSIFGQDAYPLICSEWTQERGGRVSNEMFFRKKKPFGEIWVSTWRGRVPSLNRVSLSLDAKAFATGDGVKRLEAIVLSFIDWSQAIYATAWHTKQAHCRVAQMTPLKRLERLDWLTFFGRPYLELFGGEARVLSVPWFSAQQVFGGALLTAAACPDSPQMVESDQTLLDLEQYLGDDAFARDFYLQETCRVPSFDLSETTTGQSEVAKENDPRFLEPIFISDPKTNEPLAVAVLTPPDHPPES